MKNKIALINCFSGIWPPWFKYFLLSISKNSTIDWIFFADNYLPDIQGENVLHHTFTLEDFSQLASLKLGFEIELNNPYKLCDFKPAYGKIFEDYLSGYDFWGYFDIDVIFGDIISFISKF